MPTSKILRKRGTTIYLETYAERLFVPGGPMSNWLNSVSQKARVYAAEEAPSNKRPRWAHAGKPLKTTMRATTVRGDASGLRVHQGVGSTAAHAVYVELGTGVYAGNSPYEAKILPPWTRGGPDLYESHWRPYGGKRLKQVMIKGQRGQGFLQKGQERAFASAGLHLRPSLGGEKVQRSMTAGEIVLTDIEEDNPNKGLFIQQRDEWRQWRDDAWADARQVRDRYNAKTRPKSTRKTAKKRNEGNTKSTKKPKTPTLTAKQRAVETDRIKRAYADRRVRVRRVKVFPDGTYALEAFIQGGWKLRRGRWR